MSNEGSGLNTFGIATIYECCLILSGEVHHQDMF